MEPPDAQRPEVRARGAVQHALGDQLPCHRPEGQSHHRVARRDEEAREAGRGADGREAIRQAGPEAAPLRDRGGVARPPEGLARTDGMDRTFLRTDPNIRAGRRRVNDAAGR